jgi:hypothetical protein
MNNNDDDSNDIFKSDNDDDSFIIKEGDDANILSDYYPKSKISSKRNVSNLKIGLFANTQKSTLKKHHNYNTSSSKVIEKDKQELDKWFQLNSAKCVEKVKDAEIKEMLYNFHLELKSKYDALINKID